MKTNKCDSCSLCVSARSIFSQEPMYIFILSGFKKGGGSPSSPLMGVDTEPGDLWAQTPNTYQNVAFYKDPGIWDAPILTEFPFFL